MLTNNKTVKNIVDYLFIKHITILYFLSIDFLIKFDLSVL